LLLRTRIVRQLGLLSLFTALAACEAVPTEKARVTKLPVGTVSVGIKPIENVVLPAEPLEILFYVNNATDDSVEILPWGTPLEKTMTADRFSVSINGETIPYGGPVVKRPGPGPEDYITLVAGEKKETVVSVSDNYDVSAAGEYKIQLKTMLFQRPKADFLTPTMVETAVVVTRQ